VKQPSYIKFIYKIVFGYFVHHNSNSMERSQLLPPLLDLATHDRIHEIPPLDLIESAESAESNPHHCVMLL
jgi:hypothetical protein